MDTWVILVPHFGTWYIIPMFVSYRFKPEAGIMTEQGLSLLTADRHRLKELEKMGTG